MDDPFPVPDWCYECGPRWWELIHDYVTTEDED